MPFANPIVLCLICSFLLVACSDDSSSDRDWVLGQGDWGWQNGVGCTALKDVLRIKGDNFEHHQNGKLIAKGKFLDRAVVYQTSSSGTGGKVDGTRWSYILRMQNGKTEAFIEQLNLKRSNGVPIALIAAPKRTVGNLKFKTRTRQDNPRGGESLVPCETKIS